MTSSKFRPLRRAFATATRVCGSRPGGRRLRIEALEDRQLLSTVAEWPAGAPSEFVTTPQGNSAFVDEGASRDLLATDRSTRGGVRKIVASDGAEGDRFGSAVATTDTYALVGAPYDDDHASDSGSAYVFDAQTGEPLWKLTASNAADRLFFGASVAVHGDSAIVGAYGYDHYTMTRSAGAYVFDLTAGNELLQLIPAVGTAEEGFGASVAVFGNYAVVGSPRETNASGHPMGAAYIFDLTTGDELHRLTPVGGYALDQFGISVAIDGNHVLVGADEYGSAAGAAYVFDVTTGELLHRLTASDGSGGDQFGCSVDLDGNHAIVGAREAGFGSAGAAYVFDLTTGTQVHKLTSSDMDVFDYFGCAVSMAGDYAVIGASGDDTVDGNGMGSAYLFDVTTGQEIQKFTTNQTTTFPDFGGAVAVADDCVLVGAPQDTSVSQGSGSVFLFDLALSGPEIEVQHGGVDIAHRDTTPSTDEGTDYGTVLRGTTPVTRTYRVSNIGPEVLSISGLTVPEGFTIVEPLDLGIPAGDYDDFTIRMETASIGAKSGAVRFVTNDANESPFEFDVAGFVAPNFTEEKVTASDGEASDEFGWSVAISGNYAIVGAWMDHTSGGRTGSAYVYDATTGQELHRLTASDGASDDRFGCSVAVSGDYAIVGAYLDGNENGSVSGAAYVFHLATGEQVRKLIASDGAHGDWFGCSVGLSGDYAVVGAHYHESANGPHSGAAYLFDITTGQEMRKLVAADSAPYDHFGYSVAIAGGKAIVGAMHDDEPGSSSGSAFVFDVATGEQIHKLTADDSGSGDYFGTSVSISDAFAIVGANADEDNGLFSGSAYIFDLSTGQQLHKLTPPDGAEYDDFGGSVSISDKYAIVGSKGDDDTGESSGSAYVFDAATGRQLHKWTASDGAEFDAFGFSVAVSGNRAIVGSRLDDAHGTESGSAYLFTLEAGTILVDTVEDESDGNHDPGDLSLREALLIAKNNPGPDVITFDPALNGQTISLSLGVLMLDSDMTITGPGRDLLTVDGGGTCRVMAINPDQLDDGPTVEMSGLTIARGQAPSWGRGGGIYAYTSHLTLSDVALLDNNATYGSGLFQYDGALNLTDVEFVSNSSRRGGGAYLQSVTTTITGVEFRENSGQLEGGGGIYQSGGTLNLTDATFTGNSTAYFGGGMRLNSGESTLTNVTFNGNSAGSSGGAIYFEGSSRVSRVENATFSGNTCGRYQWSAGGAVGQAGGEVDYTNVTLRENRADRGGAFLLAGGTARFDGSTLDENTATYGGAVYINGGRFYASQTDLNHNTASTGGAVYAWYDYFYSVAPQVNLDGGEMVGNSAIWGGAIAAGRGSQVTLEGVFVQGNTADSSGGAVFADGAGAVVEVRESASGLPSQLLDNTAADYGGAAFAVNDAKIQLLGAVVTASGIAGNAAHAGGALAAYRGGDLELVGTTIEGHAAAVGGAIYVSGEGSTLTVSDASEPPTRSDILQNTAKIGGGLFVTNGGQATIGITDFSENTASVRGGAIAVEGTGSSIALTGVHMANNMAVAIGGGLYVAAGATADITDGTISGTGLLPDQRNAFLGGGVAIERGGTAMLNGTSVTGNLAVYGGGLFVKGADSSITLLGATVAGNSASRLGNETFHDSLAHIFADLATTVDDEANDAFGAIALPPTPAPVATSLAASTAQTAAAIERFLATISEDDNNNRESMELNIAAIDLVYSEGSNA